MGAVNNKWQLLILLRDRVVFAVRIKRWNPGPFPFVLHSDKNPFHFERVSKSVDKQEVGNGESTRFIKNVLNSLCH